MNNKVKIIFDIVSNLNNKKDTWSYLTSIEYMLKSKLYMDSIYHDAKTVASYLFDKKNCKILDFGTGCGIFALALSQIDKSGTIYAIDTVDDKSQKDPNFNDTTDEQRAIWNEFEKSFKVKFDHYNGSLLPFSDNSFDMIIANAVIEHIEPSEQNNIFTELKRILKKDGILFIFKTPRKLAYTEYLAGWLKYGRHEILYGDREITELLKANEFKILKRWKSNMVPEFPDKITNRLYPILRKIDNLLYFSPMRIFAHHNNFVLQKFE